MRRGSMEERQTDAGASIVFANVTKRFGAHTVIHGLTRTVRGGCITAVTGINGSGKSTFLKLAAHLIMPEEGAVHVAIDGEEVRRAALRAKIALVTPELRFYARLTAWENLAFVLGARGKKLTKEGYEALLGRVGLAREKTGGMRVEGYSTGMRQRLKLAALFGTDARIWLLDEPGANLDEAGREMVRAEARAAAGRGTLVLWATNDAGEEAEADETIRLAGHLPRLS
ncbi:ABC transporter, ATP-binding protein [Mitsuokella sp. oral taxon 131 str. W9106]|nr:ABC transporter, ATP-binding protein [Mitsuokella sp. oral taxon 131 str. W9106]